MDELEIEPSDNFRNEVEQALKLENQEEKRDALNEVCKKYGYFWAKTIRLGGLIVKHEKQHKKTNVQSTGGTIDFDATLETTPIDIHSGSRYSGPPLQWISVIVEKC